MASTLNKTDHKPYDKFVVDSSNPIGDGSTVDSSYRVGQAKYANEDMEPMTCDKTRFTADDEAAYQVNMGGEMTEDPTYGGKE